MRLPADDITTADTALAGFGLLQAKSKRNGHRLGIARIVESGSGRGYMGALHPARMWGECLGASRSRRWTRRRPVDGSLPSSGQYGR